MAVKISNYGKINDKNFIEYLVDGLSSNQMKFLNEHLEEETEIDGNIFKLKMYFEDDLYPLQSDAAKFKLEDFITREEIEMGMFLESFLDDM